MKNSKHTVDRIKSAQIVALDSDEELVAESDIILSIVPPRDAIATARRALEASRSHEAINRRSERKGTAVLGQAPSLTYIDLNAISPRSAKTIAGIFTAEPPPSLPRRLSITRSFSFRKNSEPEPEPIPIKYLDGGIIGGPPSLKHDQTWKRPSIVLSGPGITELLPDALISLLNIKVVGSTIGPGSALKACFASLTKGLTALSILSFTTAKTAGVLPELQEHLKEYSPNTLALASNGLVGMPPKAYRWVDEMRQIGETFTEDGGFGHGIGGGQIYEGIAEIYKLIADDTVLGEERVEKRKRGTTAEDVADCVKEGIARKKQKGQSDEDLDQAWRGRWS
jgi:3-hydroxyisobutyrate dehydrogenase-like beta-hydroxyacid dehydrogenase